MNVLIAESESSTADSIQRLVEQMGHTADWVCTGRETLASLEEKPCELLILSAQLRDADILNLLPSLREIHPDLPVVALTSRNSLTLEQQVRRLGVVYYLIKPLNVEELEAVVSHISVKQIQVQQGVHHEEANIRF